MSDFGSDLRAFAPQNSQPVHIPVLRSEVLDALRPKAGMRFLDGTLGLGGHASAILEKSGGQAWYCGLDRDGEALALAAQRLQPWADRCRLFHLDYADFPQALSELGWTGVDGALLDLGVSSLQLDKAERGFSLHGDGPLDMRMNSDALPGVQKFGTAGQLINKADYACLKDIIARYGEDPMAGRIAGAIVEARQRGEIAGTAQLAEIVYNAYPLKWRKTARNHPATRTFQAVRMVINDELGQLERFLDEILPNLAPGGRLAIISFHSLEDRLVKQKFRLWATDCICPPHTRTCTCGHRAEIREITRKPVTPSPEEANANPRAASAKLRVAEKLGEKEAA